MKSNVIAYPLAYSNNQITSIKDAKHGTPYYCIECKNPMIPKMGKIKIHHFSHKYLGECNPDNALHETAKLDFIRQFNEYLQSGGEYDINIPCSKCHQLNKHNLIPSGIEIKPEHSVIEKTRSDLVILKKDGSPHSLIEIVVTHDLDTPTYNEYLKSKIPIIKITPTWDNLNIIDSTMNVICNKCKIRNDDVKSFMVDIVKNENISKDIVYDEYEKYDNKNVGLDVFLPKPPKYVNNFKDIVFKEIIKDKYNRQLYSKIRNLVNKYGRRLVAGGFVQQSSRLTLFRYENEYWTVYADLDSTDVMAIWEVDGEPRVYAFTKRKLDETNCHPDCEACVIKITRKKLHNIGVPTRYGFYDYDSHWHKPYR